MGEEEEEEEEEALIYGNKKSTSLGEGVVACKSLLCCKWREKQKKTE